MLGSRAAHTVLEDDKERSHLLSRGWTLLRADRLITPGVDTSHMPGTAWKIGVGGGAPALRTQDGQPPRAGPSQAEGAGLQSSEGVGQRYRREQRQRDTEGDAERRRQLHGLGCEGIPFLMPDCLLHPGGASISLTKAPRLNPKLELGKPTSDAESGWGSLGHPAWWGARAPRGGRGGSSEERV